MVHLKLLLQNAESQLSELHNTNEQLQATVEFLTDERNKLNTDKMQLLEVLENKVPEMMEMSRILVYRLPGLLLCDHDTESQAIY